MIRYIWGLLVVCCCFPAGSLAQELSLSPYSRYGIGDILSGSTTRNAAMGGIGVASDNYFSINRINPASFADIVFTTMDISGFSQLSQLRSADSDENQATAGFQNLMFAFPSNNGPVLTMGFAPYSGVGYEVLDINNVELQDTTFLEETRYFANGGLSQAFIGVAFKTLKKRLRLGVNLQFSFGNTKYEWNKAVRSTDLVTPTLFREISVTNDTYVRGYIGQLGFIYEDTLNASKLVLWRLGAVVDYTLNLNGDQFTTFSNSAVLDTLDDLVTGKVVVPPKIGVGFMINRPGFYSFGADLTYQDWSQFEYFDDVTNLGTELRIGAGGEWTPNFQSFSYLKQINYRFGAYWRKSYINIGQESVQDYGVTLGIGLPAGRKGNSRLNQGRATSRVSLSAELGRRGNLNTDLNLEELYVRFRLGISLNDRWFIRRVVD